MSDLGFSPNLTQAELLQLYEEINTAFINTKLLGVASFALVLYDYLICLNQEVRRSVFLHFHTLIIAFHRLNSSGRVLGQ